VPTTEAEGVPGEEKMGTERVMPRGEPGREKG
jgi:hypothetical protein